MLISDSHKFIFIHIRKAAGSSVANCLKPYSIEKPSSLLSKIKSKSRFEHDYQKFYFQLHDDIMLVKKVMPADTFNNYFKFAYVRNPWKRLLSEYLFIRRNTEHGRYKKVIKMNFSDYIFYQAKRFDAHQVNMLTDKKGSLQMDFVAKFENLHEDWETICTKTGIKHINLPHLNSNPDIDYNDYFNAKNIALIEKLWKRDIDMFEYSFDD